uniref:Uncharacterized protein n=1 Tax=Picea sitchensis TaxID=3332 RepID=A9P162_PICSI|nr:unknown [Picea sitchensis]
MGDKLLEGSGNMGTHRLCNTSYTEFAVNLPLPHLPTSFGANSRELRLVEEGDGVSRVRTTKNSKILSEASKIAELLKATDASYLCLRDDMKNEAALFSRNPASLLAAVLKHDPEAFKFSSSASQVQTSRGIARFHHLIETVNRMNMLALLCKTIPQGLWTILGNRSLRMHEHLFLQSS